MQAQARRDTAPELALRRTLHSVGYRYRVNYPVIGLPRRTMDIAFTRVRVAVFVHGCFWHSCSEHGTSPRANGDWWRQKIERNVVRDRETREHLEDAGWCYVEVWEHEKPEEAAGRVQAVVESRRLERNRVKA